MRAPESEHVLLSKTGFVGKHEHALLHGIFKRFKDIIELQHKNSKTDLRNSKFTRKQERINSPKPI